MAFADPLATQYNAVAKNLAKLGTGKYRLDDVATTDTKFSMRIEHTLPSKGQPGESHLVRIDAERFDSTSGEYLRTDSCWLVIKTADAAQNVTDMDLLVQMLVDFLSDANLDKVLAGEG